MRKEISIAPRTKNTIPITDWVARIDAIIKKQQRTVFELGDLLNEAKAQLAKKDFLEVIKQSGLRSKSNAENYMRVASKAILRLPEVEKHLPNGTGALIDIAAWPDEEIKYAIRCGVRHAQRIGEVEWSHRCHRGCRHR